jgi:His-Xaa-Ser system radical SAM maturase HxsB
VTRFLPAEEFAPKAYALLPCRFEPLDEGLILSNMAGEPMFIDRSRFEALVQGRFSTTDPLFPELRAKHFVREPGEQHPIELLALKVRTKYAHLADFTNLHLFVVTLRCDHSCQYCQVSRQSEDKLRYDMTPETADKALDLVFLSPNPAIKIEIQGGEPLLNWPVVEHIILGAEARNRVARRALQIVIATTLSLVTDDMLYFCRDHNVLLSSSLDGPADLHDRNRPRPGRDSHAKFVAGLTKARDIVGADAVSALMTTAPASMDRVRDIIDEYVRLGFRDIFLRHVSPYGFAAKTRSYAAYNAQKWLEFYKEGLRYILELNAAGVPFVENYSRLLLTKMLTPRDPGFVDLSNPCGAGILAVVFNYDGEVYASDESRMLKEMGDASFRIGDVHKNTYKEIFTSDALLTVLDESFTLSAPMCSDCALEPWCGTDPVFHHGMTGDLLGRKPASEFCKRQMGAVKHLLRLMRDNSDAQRLFRRWAGC